MVRRKCKTLEMFINVFPKYYRDVANSFDENINTRQENITHILSEEGLWIDIEEITTKELQWLLKHAMNRTKAANFSSRIKIEIGEEINIMQFRMDCKNPQLRNIHFRLLHNDFYTHERMFKYKMTNSPKCPRCNNIETTQHLLWECRDSKIIWNLYNEILRKVNLQNMTVESYKDIYKTESIDILSVLKMKIIKQFIQIVRPQYWNAEKVERIISEARKMELHNASKKNGYEYEKMNKKWKKFNIFEVFDGN